VTVDLSQPYSPTIVARIIGVSHQAITKLAAEGVIPTTSTVGDAVHAYCANLREKAAGRYSEGPLDLSQERAALAKAQREGVELKNAALRGTYAELALLERVLAASVGAVCERLDFLPAQIRMACPDLPQQALDVVTTAVAVARNDWARSTTSLVLDEAIPDDDDEPELPLGEEGADGAA
jgi:phage terminase Nu1 subunit (DNA packaging protein)